MIEQYSHGCSNFSRSAFVNAFQHPRCLGESEMGYPRAIRDELTGRSDLPPVVPRNQADENVRVNGAHAAPGHAGGRPPSGRPGFVAWAGPSGTRRHGGLRTCSVRTA